MSPNNDIATPQWHGRKAISLLRCSIANQAENSIRAQRNASAAYAAQNGIRIFQEHGGRS
jgi:hypothetical protein